MVRERALGGDESFQIVLAILLAAGAGAGPVGVAGRRLGIRARRHRLAFIGRADLAVRPLGRDVAAAGEAPLGPIGLRRFGGGGVPLRRLRLALGFALARALEQGIALELAFHIADEVEVGELQQLDGLHQLRRHHQRVALPELKFLG